MKRLSAAQRDAPGQLDDLGFGEMPAKPRENFIARLVQLLFTAMEYSTTSLSTASSSG